MEKLLNPNSRAAFCQAVQAEYERLRDFHHHKRTERPLLRLETVRARRFQPDWSKAGIVRPIFLGIKVFDDIDLAEVTGRIDWSPFFHAWEMKGVFPQILNDPVKGQEATRLFNDGQALLRDIVTHKRLTARAVIGFFAANSAGDDIVLYTDDRRTRVLTTFHTLRQQTDKGDDRPCLALADFVAPHPEQGGVPDYLGCFAVTAGIGAAELAAAYERDHDDYNSILVKALADRLAEALAELMHERVRKIYWGYAPDERLSNEELIKEKYRGIRPAPGYPACPDHTEKGPLFDLLNVTANIDLHLTENYAMWPAAAVSGWYFAHPEARYFTVSKIDLDQVEDYASRKGLSVVEVERWLRPNLGYGPA
jgi:5-methyltetrahydrofolate--homocysteine methyltransferase